MIFTWNWSVPLPLLVFQFTMQHDPSLLVPQARSERESRPTRVGGFGATGRDQSDLSHEKAEPGFGAIGRDQSERTFKFCVLFGYMVHAHPAGHRCMYVMRTHRYCGTEKNG
jgi:hypothetical protein